MAKVQTLAQDPDGGAQLPRSGRQEKPVVRGGAEGSGPSPSALHPGPSLQPELLTNLGNDLIAAYGRANLGGLESEFGPKVGTEYRKAFEEAKTLGEMLLGENRDISAIIEQAKKAEGAFDQLDPASKKAAQELMKQTGTQSLKEAIRCGPEAPCARMGDVLLGIYDVALLVKATAAYVGRDEQGVQMSLFQRAFLLLDLPPIPGLGR